MFFDFSFFLGSLLVVAARACPPLCQCTDDPDYEDGVLVDCKNLSLNDIPLDIPGYVTTLLLNNNNIESMDGLVYYSNLRSLDLDSNYVMELDRETLQQLPYLKILILSDNEIQEIPSRAFYGLKHLEWVDLRNNLIKRVSSDAFVKANSISYLNLMSNEITVIEKGTLKPLINHYLWLLVAKNSLTKVPTDIKDMKGIQYLSLAHNQITNINPNTFSNNKNLETLDISHNRIRYLHAGTLENNQISMMIAEGNPWQCDCYLDWLRLYLVKHPISRDIVCTEPYNYTDIRLTVIHNTLECVTPVLVSPVPELTVVEGANTTLTCIVNTEFATVVTWYKDGAMLHFQGNRFQITDGKRHLIVFKSVLYSDLGVYNCTTQDPKSGRMVTTAIDLNVLYTPIIHDSYKWLPGTANKSNDVTLKCDVAANPPLSNRIMWYHDNRLLTGLEPEVTIEYVNSSSTLYLQHAPDKDITGEYTCNAVNSLGQARETFIVSHSDILNLNRSVKLSLHLFILCGALFFVVTKYVL